MSSALQRAMRREAGLAGLNTEEWAVSSVAMNGILDSVGVFHFYLGILSNKIVFTVGSTFVFCVSFGSKFVRSVTFYRCNQIVMHRDTSFTYGSHSHIYYDF